jgi:hypothetical protein
MGAAASAAASSPGLSLVMLLSSFLKALAYTLGLSLIVATHLQNAVATTIATTTSLPCLSY